MFQVVLIGSKYKGHIYLFLAERFYIVMQIDLSLLSVLLGQYDANCLVCLNSIALDNTTKPSETSSIYAPVHSDSLKLASSPTPTGKRAGLKR